MMDEGDVSTGRPAQAAEVEIDVDRDRFMRTLIREISGTLEEVIGFDQAVGFFSTVGLSMGEQLDRSYREALHTTTLTREQVAEVLVNLKRRIDGDFFLIEQNADRIVLGTRSCPFGEKVLGRRSMCMMTSNVMGTIAAENLGYGKVELRDTIAEGAPECRIVVHLRMQDSADTIPGREYFKTGDDDPHATQ